ncbi:hypothetical protein TraAM80_05128 [Trypanosoma rangeli]|uniref:Uncharacterized protein n=1 Tax=Trypanosoma rangeli TaxID=5698 RepID=A0A422NGB5_TRYRA|nr:uncharacterized protein TraAM80_05128 [Trypanosoma rangeli]RNF04479.1 hypothetical protein TraAM80_05128 [Trypanosoma rangeli]|eukprot:RNF04479.1 hypothetical protein TraAM80_05128 [Trypanosoma rangeli]
MTSSSSSLQHRVDAALQHGLLSVGRKQHNTGSGPDAVSPVRSPDSLPRSYEMPTTNINRNIALRATQEETDGEDEIQRLLRNAFSLAASHSPHGGIVSTASAAPFSGTTSSLSVSDNVYLNAMRTAYSLYGEQANVCLEDDV